MRSGGRIKSNRFKKRGRREFEEVGKKIWNVPRSSSISKRPKSKRALVYTGNNSGGGLHWDSGGQSRRSGAYKILATWEKATKQNYIEAMLWIFRSTLTLLKILEIQNLAPLRILINAQKSEMFMIISMISTPLLKCINCYNIIKLSESENAYRLK